MLHSNIVPVPKQKCHSDSVLKKKKFWLFWNLSWYPQFDGIRGRAVVEDKRLTNPKCRWQPVSLSFGLEFPLQLLFYFIFFAVFGTRTRHRQKHRPTLDKEYYPFIAGIIFLSPSDGLYNTYLLLSDTDVRNVNNKRI